MNSFPPPRQWQICRPYNDDCWCEGCDSTLFHKTQRITTQLTAFLPEMIHRKNWPVLAKAEGFCPCPTVCLSSFLPFFLTESSVQYIAVVWVITPHSWIGIMKEPDYVLSWSECCTINLHHYANNTLYIHTSFPWSLNTDSLLCPAMVISLLNNTIFLRISSECVCLIRTTWNCIFRLMIFLSL
jgi:hypothetical protein